MPKRIKQSPATPAEPSILSLRKLQEERDQARTGRIQIAFDVRADSELGILLDMATNHYLGGASAAPGSHSRMVQYILEDWLSNRLTWPQLQA